MARWQRIILGVTIAKLCFALFACVLTGTSQQPPVPRMWLYAGLAVEFAAIGVFLLWQSRDGDIRAQLLGTILLLVASPFADPLLRKYGPPLGGTMALLATSAARVTVDAWLPAVLWLFTVEFPEPLPSPRSRRWATRTARLSGIVGALLFVVNVTALLPDNVWASAVLRLRDLLSPESEGHYWTVAFLLALPAWPFLMWRARHARADQRRRITIFVGGLMLGLLPVTIEVLLETLIPPYRRLMEGPADVLSSSVIYLSLAATPIVTAYSVFFDRVVDIRLILRAAVQYSLARLTILVVILGPFATLAGYVYTRRDQTLSHILSGPGPLVLAALTLAGLVALGVRERAIGALDRRFFREQYDARQILAALAEGPRQPMELRDMVSHITAEIDRALHLLTIGILVTDERGEMLRSLDGRFRPLPATARLAALFTEDQSPLEVDLSSSRSFLRGLPAEERQWLADGGFRLLLPMVSSDGALLGLLGLGEKRSELGFSREDLDLLAMIRESLALRLENRRLRSSPGRSPALRIAGADRWVDDAATECKECWSVYPHDMSACACGGRVQRAPVPYVLHGKFRLEKRIGAGGMGVVYRAIDLSLDRSVAIKTLPQVSPEFATRLRREARAMAAVSHPNLALIYGAEMWQSTPMLICEYLSGGTLADRLRVRRLTSNEAVTLGLVLADVLGYIHSVGMIHCDIKPSNIGYTAAGAPKLLDFGLARIAGDVQQPRAHATSKTPTAVPSNRFTGRLLSTLGSNVTGDSRRFFGTPLYMSPEAMSAETPSTLFDLWSLAIVLFEAIAGMPPFTGHAIPDLLAQITASHRPDIRDSQPDCPESFAIFFKMALAADRSVRPQTAEALSKALGTLRAEHKSV